jgi:hypothetical protein
MTDTSPRITEDTLHGWRAVHLRNDALQVTILPGKGGEIHSLIDRRTGTDLLWKAPWGLRPPPISVPAGPDSQFAWMDHYAGGWQEMFPNPGGACTVAGAAHTFHGEASVVPWTCTAAPDEDGKAVARMEARLARTPFRLEKHIALDPARPVLRIWERITNEGSDPQPYAWGHHPAFGAPFLAGGCRLDVPARTFLAAEEQVSPRATVQGGARSEWPNAVAAGGAGTVDLSIVPAPESHTDRFGYILDLEEGWYALSNDELGIGFALSWPLDVLSCVWLWQELGGTREYPWWGNTYVMGVEPNTSYPADAGLATAIERGNARTLAPGESQEIALTAALFTPRGRVKHVSPHGTVAFD